jgi:hypothetical protein
MELDTGRARAKHDLTSQGEGEHELNSQVGVEYDLRVKLELSAT